MKNLSLIALFFLVFASCQQADDLATPSSSLRIDQRGPRARPFNATLQSSINPGNPLTPCVADIPEFPAFAIPDHFLAGQATHLGNLNATLSTLHHDDCSISTATASLTTNVSGQLAAANGDLVYYDGLDVINILNLLIQNPDDQTGPITGTWTITGGTGRFTNATGSFTLSGTVNFVTGTFSATATGTITY